MKRKTAAVIPAKGIGDGLLMMIASDGLYRFGYHVTTFHIPLQGLSNWFPHHHFDMLSSNIEKTLSPYDLIIAQNDNSETIKTLISLYQKKKLCPLSVFYITYEPHKHRSLSFYDQIFDPSIPLTENIAKATSKVLGKKEISKHNGLSFPPSLRFKYHLNRIAIHPTSAEDKKNWPKKKFLDLAKKLKEKGFDPVFTVSEEERPFWRGLGFEVPLFKTLDETAHFIGESAFLIGNDSALGHLASNLHIPTLIIGDCEKRMKYWRPGWLLGKVVTPPPWIPHIKWMRLRKKYWKKWVSVRRVFKEFLPNGNDWDSWKSRRRLL